jgi:hypothetical protein
MLPLHIRCINIRGSIPLLHSLTSTTTPVQFRFYLNYFLIYFFSFVVTQINECDTRAEQPKNQENKTTHMGNDYTDNFKIFFHYQN